MQRQLPQNNYGFNQKGFTVLELVITILILSIGLALSIPSMSSMVNKNRADSHRNELYTSLLLARSEAAKSGSTVSLCPTTNASSCVANSSNWKPGWLIFIDDNGDGSYDSTDDVILRVQEALSGELTLVWAATNSTQTIRYNSQGFLIDGGGEFSLCPNSGNDVEKRGIRLNGSGRPYTTKGGDVTC